jgi:hypothetical protein
MLCRTNCKQQTDNRAIHCVEASAAARVLILEAGLRDHIKNLQRFLDTLGGMKSSLAAGKLDVEANAGCREIVLG